MASLKVSLVSADSEVWTGTGRMVVARTTEGEIGILPGHEPMLAILGAGAVRVTLEDGGSIAADAADGFLSVENDTITIVARHAALTNA